MSLAATPMASTRALSTSIPLEPLSVRLMSSTLDILTLKTMLFPIRPKPEHEAMWMLPSWPEDRFYPAGLNKQCVTAIRPPLNPLSADESAAVDLFGPDDVEWAVQSEPAVASRDAVDGGELRIDGDELLGLMNPCWCKPLRDCLLQPNLLPSRLLFTGSLIFLTDRGADGAFLPSGGMHLTSDCLTTQERYRCLLLTIVLLEILEMKML